MTEKYSAAMWNIEEAQIAGWLLFQRPLIRQLIIGMVGILLMKHNLQSSTHFSTVHQLYPLLFWESLENKHWGAATQCQTLSRVFDTVEECHQVPPSLPDIYFSNVDTVYSHTGYSWAVLLSQIFMRLCTVIVHSDCEHDDMHTV